MPLNMELLNKAASNRDTIEMMDQLDCWLTETSHAREDRVDLMHTMLASIELPNVRTAVAGVLAQQALRPGCAWAIEALASSGDVHVLRGLAGQPWRDGLTPALWAARNNHPNAIRALANCRNERVGRSLAQHHPIDGHTPAHWAAKRGHHLVVDALAAVAVNNPHVLASLTAQISDAESGRSPDPKTAAQLAAQFGHANVIRSLGDTADPCVLASLRAVKPREGFPFRPEVVGALYEGLRRDELMNMALGDLEKNSKNTLASDLRNELQCFVSCMPFALRGQWRPVHLTQRSASGDVYFPQRCVSYQTAQELIQRDQGDPVDRAKIAGWIEAPLHGGLISAVLKAYEAHAGNLGQAREAALRLYRLHSAEVANAAASGPKPVPKRSEAPHFRTYLQSGPGAAGAAATPGRQVAPRGL